MEQSRYTSGGGERLYHINQSYLRDFVRVLNEAGFANGNVSTAMVAALIGEHLSLEHQAIVTLRLVGQSYADIATEMNMDEAIVKSIVDEAPYHILPSRVHRVSS